MFGFSHKIVVLVNSWYFGVVFLIKCRWRLVWVAGSEFRKIPKVDFNFSNFGCFCLGSVDHVDPREVAPEDHL